MRQPAMAVSLSALLVALALAGCGSGSGAPQPSSAVIPVKSPTISNSILPAEYTCDGRDVAPPLEWGSVPSKVGQLALIVVGIATNPITHAVKFIPEWAVVGLNPALHKLAAGEVPPGATVGLASGAKKRRYSLCPKPGTSMQYQFELYGMPSGLTASPNFTDIALLRALNEAGPTRADAHGGILVTYKRSAHAKRA